MTLQILPAPSVNAIAFDSSKKQVFARSPSTRPRTPQSSKTVEQEAGVPDSAGAKQRASKRYTARRMLTALEEPLPSRSSTPQTRSRRSTPSASTLSAERQNSTRRYATRSTVVSIADDTNTAPQRTIPPSAFKSPSKRQALFTLRRKLSVESIPLNRIPSFMDHFLNYQSPSVDYDSEEIMLELAYRIKLNKLHYILGPIPSSRHIPRSEARCIQFLWDERDLWASMSADDGFDIDMDSTTQTRLPDSFERSTSSWTDV
ncbi:hypothetical protein V5O48_001926 [Marasmius crinis-equi]|uniref:Uncharacterized protein n=1 Tax=Marasmius crinis-equi TaxID=585013 RepID=A0ABR3FX23_9AGAR